MRIIYIATLVLFILLYGGCSDGKNTYITISTDEFLSQYKAGAVDACVDNAVDQAILSGIMLSKQTFQQLVRHCIVRANVLMEQRSMPDARTVPIPTPLYLEPAGPT